MTERLLSRAEVAAWLGVPVKTLAAMAYKRTGPPFYRVGRHARYSRRDCEAWLEQQRRGVPA